MHFNCNCTLDMVSSICMYLLKSDKQRIDKLQTKKKDKIECEKVQIIIPYFHYSPLFLTHTHTHTHTNINPIPAIQLRRNKKCRILMSNVTSEASHHGPITPIRIKVIHNRPLSQRHQGRKNPRVAHDPKEGSVLGHV